MSRLKKCKMCWKLRDCHTVTLWIPKITGMIRPYIFGPGATKYSRIPPPRFRKYANKQKIPLHPQHRLCALGVKICRLPSHNSRLGGKAAALCGKIVLLHFRDSVEKSNRYSATTPENSDVSSTLKGATSTNHVTDQKV